MNLKNLLVIIYKFPNLNIMILKSKELWLQFFYQKIKQIGLIDIREFINQANKNGNNDHDNLNLKGIFKVKEMKIYKIWKKIKNIEAI